MDSALSPDLETQFWWGSLCQNVVSQFIVWTTMMSGSNCIRKRLEPFDTWRCLVLSPDGQHQLAQPGSVMSHIRTIISPTIIKCSPPLKYTAKQLGDWMCQIERGSYWGMVAMLCQRQQDKYVLTSKVQNKSNHKQKPWAPSFPVKGKFCFCFL